MADKNIGSLTQATELNDDSLLVAEQQGEAVSVSGSLLKSFAVAAAAEEADRAEEAASKTPVIQNGTWWTWDATNAKYVDSGVSTQGRSIFYSTHTTGNKMVAGNLYYVSVDTIDTGDRTLAVGDLVITVDGYLTQVTLVASTYCYLNCIIKVFGNDGADGADGADGYTPVKGVDYFDGADGADGADGYTPVKGVDYFDGADGADGADGYTPVKGVDYFDGANGADGAAGADGYTPVKGVDYFDGADGADGVSIVSVEQTTTSTEDSGVNKITVTLSDGTTSSFTFLNGSKGATGAQGSVGPQGVAGADGADGVSCTHAWNGTTLTINSASGSSSVNLKGDKGDTGATGEAGADGTNGTDGADGYTPVKGTDYWTDEDKQEILDELGETGVGRSVEGTEYTVSGETVTAGTGAEIFNSYTKNTAIGEHSHAEGWCTTASGDYSHAECYMTTASGSYSHAEGCQTKASGDTSHAEGFSTTASAPGSHAEGYKTTASGDYSHAEGSQTTASGRYSHAEGRYARAIGSDSHAEGYYTAAGSSGSHAEGTLTQATGPSSHAEGWKSYATGTYSHAEGMGTYATGEAQHAQGKYNIVDNEEKYANIVGNGTDSARSNAHTLDWEGNAWYAGDVYVGSDNEILAKASDIPTIISAFTNDANYVSAAYTEDDEGKFLRIVSGVPAWTTVPNAEEASF